MKLARNEFTVESNVTKPSYDFDIKDPAIIFDILCTKMYENPLKILVQEYMCNARDSHREHGNESTPIEVILPTTLSPTVKFKDFGVGISPDRMKDVFIFLGESTKNASDHQTGGFGIGAKTAWAYTESFNIITIYDGIKYTYLAFLGNNGCGQLDLLDEVLTDEINGTTIEISIKKEDHVKLENYVFSTGHFWEVRPVIKNSIYTTDYHSTEYKITNGNDIVATNVDSVKYSYLKDYNNSVMIVLDGIIYKSVTNYIDKAKCTLKSKYDSSIFLHFNTGELKPTINRENILNTKESLETIDNKCKFVANIITEEFIKEISIIDEFDKLSEYLTTYDIKKFELIENMTFKFKGVDFQYYAVGNSFFMKIDDEYLVAKKYGYNQLHDILKYNDHVSKITINDIKNGYVVFKKKYTKTINRVAIKQYCKSTDHGSVIIITPKEVVVNVKPVDAEMMAFISDNMIRYNDLGIPANKKEFVKVREYVMGKFIWANLFDHIDDCEIILNFSLKSYEIDYLSPYIHLYKKYINKNMKVVVISQVNMKKLPEKYLKIMIEPKQFLNMVYKEVTKMLSSTEYKTLVRSDISFSGIGIVDELYKYTNSINDSKFSRFIKLNKEYVKRFDSIRLSKKQSEVLDIYRKLSHNPDFNNDNDNNIKGLRNLVKRKNRIFNRDMNMFVKKYPLVKTITHHSIDSNDVIEYINIIHDQKLNLNKGECYAS